MRFVLVSSLVLAAGVSALAQPAAPPPPPNVVSSSAGSLRIEKLATLEFPWGLALLPDGRVLVTEKPGRLRVWANGALSEPLTGVPNVVYRGTAFEQGGLMDVEADPNFAQNKLVYLSFSEASEQKSDAGETADQRFGNFVDLTDNIVRGGAVARARLEGNELRDVEVIWRQVPKTIGRGHFGNRIVFSSDGKMFITSGDRMRFDPAQTLTSNLGKIVRIHSDGSTPNDNPFVGKENARGDIWSYGHRNILSAAIDPSSGRLWAVEMGPLGGDELNLVQAGKNYGWPFVSNGDNYSGPMIPDHPTRGPTEYQAPVRSWTPVLSASGATFYRGSLLPWRGSMLVGGLSSRSLIRFQFDGERLAIEERIDMKRRIRDVIEAPDGALYLITDDKNGEFLRVKPERR